MKGQITKITHASFWVLLPLFLWWSGTQLRDNLIIPFCAKDASNCLANSIPAIDRFLIGMEDSRADYYSYCSQNLSALFAFCWALLLAWLPKIKGQTSNAKTIATSSLHSCITLIQVAGWNGVFTELSHLIGQRPRPFVYIDPVARGLDPAHYTSFYSGHTSFTAAMVIASLLLTRAHTQSKTLFVCVALVSESLILTTAHFRILAGRHFLTDVIAGAVAGTLVAYGVVTLRLRSKSELA